MADTERFYSERAFRRALTLAASDGLTWDRLSAEDRQGYLDAALAELAIEDAEN